MASDLLSVILIFLAADFLFERLLSYLNIKHLDPNLPGLLAGTYQQDRYEKSIAYTRANERFSTVLSVLSFLLTLALLLTASFGGLDEFLRRWTEHPVWLALLYFGVIGLLADFLGMPFDIYHTFVLEERFGFNKTTVRTYVLDKLKSWLLAAVLGGGILAFIVWAYHSAGSLFFLYAFLAISLIQLLLTLFYSQLIVPLFNRQEPLGEGPLRTAIEEFAAKTGFRLANIYIMDASKRSGKGNAYFTGLGPKKRIVLYDTLTEMLDVDEIIAVLAHEIGHYKKRHSLFGYAEGILQLAIFLGILSYFVGNPSLSYALGAVKPSFHVGILALGLLYSPLSLFLGIVFNSLSRRHEYQADLFAAGHYDGKALQRALIKLSSENLSNLRPHPLYVFVHYSHPPLLNRLSALETIPPGNTLTV